MSDLLSSLGLEFVDPTTANTGLKQLKPTDENQIFSVILSIPGLQNTAIKYKRHNFYNQIKRNLRCSGGSCCAKAEELNSFLQSLPDSDDRKKQKPRAQTRLIFPVVVYQGKTVQSYGGPIEVRYIDVAEASYIKWDEGRAAVDETITPYYHRDFIMKSDPSIKGAPVMTHLENRAKWLVDPALNAEVMTILQSPDFIDSYIKVVPPIMSDEEFMNSWRAAMDRETQAEKAVAAQQTQQTQQVVQTQWTMPSSPYGTPGPVYATQPVQPAQPIQMAQPTVDMNIMNTPHVTAQEAIQPAQVQQVVQTPVQQAVDVAFTPQNIINGSYPTTPLTGTISPEAVVNMQPAQPVEVQQVAQAPVQEAAAPVQATTSQAEINLDGIGSLDAIISQLPQV